MNSYYDVRADSIAIKKINSTLINGSQPTTSLQDNNKFSLDIWDMLISMTSV